MAIGPSQSLICQPQYSRPRGLAWANKGARWHGLRAISSIPLYLRMGTTCGMTGQSSISSLRRPTVGLCGPGSSLGEAARPRHYRHIRRGRSYPMQWVAGNALFARTVACAVRGKLLSSKAGARGASHAVWDNTEVYLLLLSCRGFLRVPPGKPFCEQAAINLSHAAYALCLPLRGNVRHRNPRSPACCAFSPSPTAR